MTPGTMNVLIHVARLSGADYIEQPIEKPWLGKFVWGLLIGAAVTAGMMVM